MWNQNPKQWVAEGQYLGLIFQSKSKFSSSKNLGNLQQPLSAPLSIQVLANSMTSVPLSRPAWSVARCPAIWSRVGAAQNNLERMPMRSVRSSKSVTILQNSIRVNCIMLDFFRNQTQLNEYSFIHGVLFDPEAVTEPRRLVWLLGPEPKFGRIVSLGKGSLLPNCPASTVLVQKPGNWEI